MGVGWDTLHIPHEVDMLRAGQLGAFRPFGHVFENSTRAESLLIHFICPACTFPTIIFNAHRDKDISLSILWVYRLAVPHKTRWFFLNLNLPTSSYIPWFIQVQSRFLRRAFSISPPKITSIGSFESTIISPVASPKCLAISEYSLESGLPKTPTSSVYKEKLASSVNRNQEGNLHSTQLDRISPSSNRSDDHQKFP